MKEERKLEGLGLTQLPRLLAKYLSFEWKHPDQYQWKSERSVLLEDEWNNTKDSGPRQNKNFFENIFLLFLRLIQVPEAENHLYTKPDLHHQKQYKK